MAVDFFSRIKQAEEEKQTHSATTRQIDDQSVILATKGPTDPIAQTPEQYNEYLRVREKYDREGMIREIASDIMKRLCTREDGNLSAGDCARWCVQAAVALMKYSKQAAENEESIWSEDEDCNDYLFADGTSFEESENYGHY